MAYTTFGNYIRHLLHASLKEATYASYLRLHATFMVNMVAKNPVQPEKLWKIFTDKPKQAVTKEQHPQISPQQAKLLQEAFLSGAKEVIRREENGKQ